MTLRDQFECIEAANKAIVMHQTWGHLEAEPGTKHPGWILFACGQHGDVCVIESHFPSFGEGPLYFSNRQDYLMDLMDEGGPCRDTGVYLFSGVYRRFKNGNSRFIGKVKRAQISGVAISR